MDALLTIFSVICYQLERFSMVSINRSFNSDHKDFRDGNCWTLAIKTTDDEVWQLPKRVWLAQDKVFFSYYILISINMVIFNHT